MRVDSKTPFCTYANPFYHFCKHSIDNDELLLSVTCDWYGTFRAGFPGYLPRPPVAFTAAVVAVNGDNIDTAPPPGTRLDSRARPRHCLEAVAAAVAAPPPPPVPPRRAFATSWCHSLGGRGGAWASDDAH